MANDDFNAWNDPYLEAGMYGLGIAADVYNTESTNAANERNVAATNASNELINERNIGANKELWQMNAEWNSLPEQVKRARAAGYSPAALLGSSGFNATTSAASVPSPIPMQSFQRERMHLGESAGPLINALKQIAEQRKVNADARNVEINNETQDLANRTKIRKEGSEADKVQQEYDFFDANWNTAQRKAEAEAYKAYEEGQRAKYEADIARIEDYINNRYAEDEKKNQLKIMDKNLDLLDKEIANAVKQGKNIDASREEIFSRVGLNRVNTRLQQRYLDYYNDVYDYRVNQEKRDGQRAWYDYIFDGAHYMDLKYNDLANSNYSVDNAREMIKILEAQKEKARVDAQFAVADKINTYVQTLTKGIQTANHGRMTDASIESIKTAQRGYRQTIIQRATEDGFYRELQQVPLGK